MRPLLCLPWGCHCHYKVIRKGSEVRILWQRMLLSSLALKKVKTSCPTHSILLYKPIIVRAGSTVLTLNWLWNAGDMFNMLSLICWESYLPVCGQWRVSSVLSCLNYEWTWLVCCTNEFPPITYSIAGSITPRVARSVLATGEEWEGLEGAAGRPSQRTATCLCHCSCDPEVMPPH